MKLKLFFVIPLIFSLLFSSCAIKELWKKVSYTEKIENFLFTHDGKKLVIIGNKYHYIFNISKELKDILSSDRKTEIRPKFDTFSLDVENNIVGSYTLYFTGNLNSESSIETVDWLRKNRFEELSYNEFVKEEKLTGKRYLPNKSFVPEYHFNRQYSITVEYNEYEYSQSKRILLSPVAITADGALVLGGVALGAVFAYLKIPIGTGSSASEDKNETLSIFKKD